MKQASVICSYELTFSLKESDIIIFYILDVMFALFAQFAHCFYTFNSELLHNIYVFYVFGTRFVAVERPQESVYTLKEVIKKILSDLHNVS